MVKYKYHSQKLIINNYKIFLCELFPEIFFNWLISSKNYKSKISTDINKRINLLDLYLHLLKLMIIVYFTVIVNHIEIRNLDL